MGPGMEAGQDMEVGTEVVEVKEEEVVAEEVEVVEEEVEAVEEMVLAMVADPDTDRATAPDTVAEKEEMNTHEHEHEGFCFIW